MNAPLRRGACPGLSAPMPTGDGLLVRLLPTDPIVPERFAAFCEAAQQHGNGTIEVSARGSLQVRGLTLASATLFAVEVAELGIADHGGVAVLAGPLIEDEAALSEIARLRRALAAARPAVSPKVSVVVDEGGRLHLDAVAADIRLRAVACEQGTRFCVGLGGDGAAATWLGSIAPTDMADAALGLITVIAAHGASARAAEILRAEGAGPFRSAVAPWLTPSFPPPSRESAEMVGLHPLHDGTFALGIALAFGHAHAGVLAQIVRIAADHGAAAVRPAPARALLLIGIESHHTAQLTAAAAQRGFVVDARDPRRRIAACPGAPGCASGYIPARALAAALAPSLAPHLAATSRVSLHISGCPKGCAHPGPAALTVVGTARGCGIIRDASARAEPERYIDPAHLDTEIARFAAQPHEAAHG
jgi:precorrin-3B synthase